MRWQTDSGRYTRRWSRPPDERVAPLVACSSSPTLGGTVKYPSVFRRYVATLLDIAVIWFAVFSLTRIPVVASSSWGMPIAAAAVILFYEPLFTSCLCTLGQWIMRFRVRDRRTSLRIPIPIAYLRVVVKYVLGAISALTIPAREDRRGIHDLVANSIVVESRSASQPPAVTFTFRSNTEVVPMWRGDGPSC